MHCDDVNPFIEPAADGETPPPAEAAHLASCARCQARLRLAEALNRTLQARETPEPPVRFAANVMVRIRRERWRTEQIVDASFNIALITGAVLVVGGLTGLAWSLGWFTIDPAIVALATSAVGQWLNEIREQVQMVVVAAALFSSALALWWWVEGEASF